MILGADLREGIDPLFITSDVTQTMHKHNLKLGSDQDFGKIESKFAAGGFLSNGLDTARQTFALCSTQRAKTVFKSQEAESHKHKHRLREDSKNYMVLVVNMISYNAMLKTCFVVASGG